MSGACAEDRCNQPTVGHDHLCPACREKQHETDRALEIGRAVIALEKSEYGRKFAWRYHEIAEPRERLSNFTVYAQWESRSFGDALIAAAKADRPKGGA